MKTLLGIMVILLFSLSAQAQSIDDFIRMAEQNNRKLKALDTEYQLSKKRMDQVDVFPDLNVGVGIGVLPTETRLGPQRLRLGVTQQIPWPGLLDARSKVAAAQAEIKSTARSEAMTDLGFEIKKAYYNILALRRSQALMRENIDIFQSFKSIAEGRVEAGDARLSDILRIEARIQELEGEIDIYQQAEKPFMIKINRLSHRDLDTEVVMMDSLVMATPDVERALQKIALHPANQRLELSQDASEKSIDLTHYESRPKLGFGLDYVMVGQRQDIEGLDGNGRDILMPMGSIAIPLDREPYAARREEEKLRIVALQQYQEDLQAEFKAEISTAISEIEQAKVAYRMYDELILTNESNLELLLTAYTAAEVGIDELLLLYNEQVKFQLRQVDAILKSKLAEAGIEKFTDL